MTKAVWKYPLSIEGDGTYSLPAGATILSVAAQGEALCMWALVDPAEKTTEERRIIVAGTGHLLDDLDAGFIGTVLMFNGSLVLHVFEAKPHV